MEKAYRDWLIAIIVIIIVIAIIAAIFIGVKYKKTESAQVGRGISSFVSI